MRRFTPFLITLALSACIQEAEEPHHPDDRSGGDHYDGDGDDYNPLNCASAPSGTGAWEDESEDGLHCNYQDNSSGEWAYSLNSSESYCVEQEWAPYQDDGGYLKMWSWDGNRGCDWVIPW